MTHTQDNTASTPADSAAPSSAPTFTWTVADILICTVLGLVCGLVFWLYNGPGGAWWEAFNAITPGLAGLTVGPWLFAGPLGGLVIRKPGAAIYCEVIAACLSAALGNQWGLPTVYSGIAQGLGAEIILAVFLYKRFGLPVAVLSGAGAGVGAWVLEFFRGNAAKGIEFNTVYLVSLIISGAVIAGVAVYFMVKALVQTGALDKVRAGRANRQRV
ncbi:ECF transporter S component [Corynebacterium mendelii]|uniref:ECF transporter S component n=1 Tax=Corynebacterium mendelii TaxID=2765362 RepID=A0A939IW19_9CORY|nr:ECF transporter S component [Corynebacterium mendelii]MBN9644826.1 ECF transporter S component [Corynebacterium mendelii]